jgi:hypothetical protein
MTKKKTICNVIFSMIEELFHCDDDSDSGDPLLVLTGDGIDEPVVDQ